RVLEIGAVGVVDLRPAGDAGLHEMAEVVARDVALVVLHEAVPFGARADEAHVAGEDVPHLGKLVDAAGTEEAADRGDARITGLGVEVASRLPDAHGAKFYDTEGLVIPADTVLEEEDGAAVLE